MSETSKSSFVGYEYKEILVPGEQVSMYVDCYEAFGWKTEESHCPPGSGSLKPAQGKFRPWTRPKPPQPRPGRW